MTIKIGEMGLYPSCYPPLTAGKYTLSLRQSVTSSTDALPLGDVAAESRSVKIEGPRFILNPDEVHSLFPPANDRGNFYNRLPQIVMRRRTLPWERTIAAGEGDDPPWMALLLLKDDETVYWQDKMSVFNVVSGATPSPTTAQAATPGVMTEAIYRNGKLIDYSYRSKLIPTGSGSAPPPDPVIHPPVINTTNEERQKMCSAVDIPAPLFHDICPTVEETGMLTHVRVVSTEDKELLGQDEDGWFSVVTCNRFPDKDLSLPAGLKHRALLVSLEGHKENMQLAGSLADHHRIRLVVLASWEFTSKNEGDFQTTLTNIGRRGGVGLLGDAADNCVVQGEEVTDRNTLVLESAHVPLNQYYRTGEKGVGLYRGPLTPFHVEYKQVICHHADEAIVVDPITGLEQIGYSASFELGRMLGASDETLAVGLMHWRRGDYKDSHNSANVAGVALDLQIPELYDKWLAKPDILGGLMDPLGPLIQFAGMTTMPDLSYIDMNGMSMGFVAEVSGRLMNDIAQIKDVSVGEVEAGLGGDNIFEGGNVMLGQVNNYTFEDQVGSVMQVESTFRSNAVSKALEGSLLTNQ